MDEIMDLLKGWNLDIREVRERLYRASTPRERERWHAIWLLARGWSAGKVAQALERDPHTVGEWIENLRRDGPLGLTFEQTGGPPHPQPYPASLLEGGSKRNASGIWNRDGELELESSA